MYTHLDCIALRTVKLNDSKNLLSVWTRQLGRLTFAIPAGTGREARRRRALTAPLCTFEGECDVRPDRDILTIRDLRALPGSLALDSSAVKNITAMFLAEVLDLLLKKTEVDKPLSEFLFTSVDTLAALTDSRAVASFHIIFLYKLTYFAGIGPELEGWKRGAIFDMRDACFRSTAPLHRDFLQGRECTALMALSRASYASAANLPFDRYARKTALDYILQYLSLHLAPLSSLKSLEVLRALTS